MLEIVIEFGIEIVIEIGIHCGLGFADFSAQRGTGRQGTLKQPCSFYD